MRTPFWIVFLATVATAPIASAQAQSGARSAARERPAEATGNPPTFDLRDATLEDLTRIITRLTGRRMLLSTKARGLRAIVDSDRPVTAAEANRAFLATLRHYGLTMPRGRGCLLVREPDPPRTLIGPPRSPRE